jgi:hypothetical protein
MQHNTSGEVSRKPSMTLCNEHHRILRGLQTRYNNTDGMDPEGWSFALHNEGTRDGTCDECTKNAVDEIFNKTAGANGDLPEDLQFRHEPGKRPAPGEYDSRDHRIVAHVPDADGGRREIGFLDLDSRGGPHTVNALSVSYSHRRRGVATAMWEHAKTLGYKPQHSDVQFPDGKAWAEKTSSRDHDVTYHLTDNPHFALNPEHQPEDNALSISPRTHKGLYTTERPESWVNGHDYVRPYLAEIHTPKGVAQDERWGGEKFVPAEHFDKVKVHRVIPLDAHVREEYGSPGWIEGHHGDAFDTGKPLKRGEWGEPDHRQFSGYHYDGPDVRDMTPEQHQQHYDRWKGYMTGARGFGHNEFDDAKQTMAAPKDEDFDSEGMFIKRDQHGQKISSKIDPTTLHPNMNRYRDSGMGGVGEDRSVIGYVSTDALRKMHGNETDRPGVERHRESLRNGEGFTDPAMVIFDPKTHHAYLGEGNHRVQAAHEEGVSHVPVRVVRGRVDHPSARHMEHAETPYRGNLGEDYWPSDIHPSHIFASDEVLSEGKEDSPRSSPRLARLRSRLEGSDV